MLNAHETESCKPAIDGVLLCKFVCLLYEVSTLNN